MPFWTDRKLLLKRSYRYEGFFDMKNTVSQNTRVYDQNTGKFVFLENSQFTVSPFLIHSFEKPKLKTNINNLGGQNPLNGIIKYKIESFQWADVTIKIYDTFTKGQPTKENPSYSVMSWLKSLNYDAADMATTVKSGNNNYFIEKLNEPTVNLSINVLDDDGDVIEKWMFLEPRLNAIDFGTATYEADATPVISLTFSIAAADYETGS